MSDFECVHFVMINMIKCFHNKRKQAAESGEREKNEMNEMRHNPIVKMAADIIGFAVIYFGALFLYTLVSKQSFTATISETCFILAPIIYTLYRVMQTIFIIRKEI